MEKLNELIRRAKTCSVLGLPSRCTESEITEIAEAFRALEQRAEAAEAENSYMGGGARYWHDEYCAQQQRLVARIVDLEAKLSELETQEPYLIQNLEHFIAFWKKVASGSINPEKNEVNHTLWFLESLAKTELFARPAPAVSLEELMPNEIPHSANYAAGWNACRAAILRKIEEAK